MGANQSANPRTVDLENQNPAGVIDVSEEVVERLKNSLLKEKQKTTPVVIVPQPQLPNEHQLYHLPPTITQPSTHNTVNQQQIIKNMEPSVSSFDLRRQKEIELQQNDAYWQKRMSQLEHSLKKTNSIMEKEYSSAIEDVRKQFLASPGFNTSSPCQVLKVQLIACYRFNSGETLKCADEVAAFANCVCQERLRKLDSNPKIIDKTAPVDGIPRKSEENNNINSSTANGA